MNAILIGISTSLITGLIIYLVRKYYFYQPKVEINFHNKGNSSSYEGHNKLRLFWNYNIVLKNITKYDAISLKINFQDFPSNYVTKQYFTHVKSLSEEKLKLHFYSIFDKNIVESTKNRFKELMPTELSNVTLTLTYYNEMNKKFYTKYLKHKEEEENSFYKTRPKIK
jgi:hypothetical protein